MRPFLKNIILGLILLGNSIFGIAQNPNNRANIVVRNTSDNVRTAESFRWAVQQAAWSTQTNVTITFQFAAQLTTITLNSSIDIYRNAAYKTLNINGGGRIKLVGTGVKSNDGLNVESEGSVEIFGLHLENFSSAIYYSPSTYSTLTIGNPGASVNVFTKNTTAIASLGYANISNNYIGTDKSFQQNLGNDNNIICAGVSANIISNYIYSAKNDGVSIWSSGSSIIRNNTFGGSVAANGNKGRAINIVGSAFIENNTFRNNGEGISTTGKSELKNNNFYCNLGSIFTPSQPYPKPNITAINYSQNGLVTMSGTSNAEGDVIEIYTSSSFCPTLPCQGGRIRTALTNAARQWTTTFTPAVGAKVFITASKAGQYVSDVDGGGIVQGSTSVFTDCQIPLCPPVAVNLQALNNVNCFGGNDGRAKLTITPTGFGGSYEYTVSKIDNSSIVAALLPTPLVLMDTIKNLTGGRYKVTVRNKLTGCTYTTNEIIIIEPIGSLSISTCREKTPASLNILDGVGEVLVNGGSPPYTLSYRKNNGAVVNFSNTSNSIFIISSLGEGNYAVTVTDSKFGIGNPKTGCTATCTFTMSPPNCTALKLSLKQKIDVKCFGDSSGSLTIKYADILTNFPLTLTASNGFTQTITSFSPDSTVTIPTLKAGTYTISLRNNKNCPLSIAATITQFPKLDITCDTVLHAKRVGEASGAVRLTVRNGGPPPYRITITGGKDTAFVFPSLFVQFEAGKLKAGNYVAQVKDNNDCVDTCKFIVKEPDCTGYDVIAVTDSISCFGAKNGRIDLSVVGGDSLYTYKWNNPNIGNVAIANNLDVGTYKATVSDGRNCSDSVTAIIVTPSVLKADTTKEDVTIVGGKNGEISVTVSGGTPQYNVDLLFDSISIPLTERIGNRFVFKNLGKGVYIYLATDKNGCDTSGTIIIADPNCNMRLTAKADSVFCKGEKNGRVAINIINGTTPYTYKWSSNVIGNVFDTLKNVGIGLYTVTVTDSKNCKDSIQSTIFEPDSLLSTSSVNNVTTINGNDGSIRILVRGGKSPYTVKINNISGIQEFGNVFVFNNLQKGFYEYEVIDDKGCRTTKSVEITEPPCNIQIQDLVEPILCQGQRNGRITIVVTGGTGSLQYKWSDTNIGVTAIASNLAAATYTVTVTDSKNCTSEKSISVSEPTALASVFFKTDATTVNGKEGSIRLTVSGGTLPYKVRLDTASAIIESANTFVFNNLGKDLYTYTITDANQCPLSQDVIIDEPTCNIQISPLVDNVKCNGEMTGRIALTVTNAQSPLSFEWNPFSVGNTNIITDLKANAYSVTLTDGEKCTKSLTIDVTQPTKLSVKHDSIDVKNFGESTGAIRIKVSGGVAPYTVTRGNNIIAQFIRDSFVFTGLSAGTYDYTVLDSNKCTITGRVIINQPSCNMRVTAKADSVSCKGGSDGRIVLTIENGIRPYIYTWNPTIVGPFFDTIQLLTARLYEVTVADSRGCKSFASATVLEPDSLLSTFMLKNIDFLGRNNGSINVTVRGGALPYSVILNDTLTVRTNSTVLFDNLKKGTYTYRVIDAKGCTFNSPSINITEPTCSLRVTKMIQNVKCQGNSDGSIALNVSNSTGTLIYKWDDLPSRTTAEAIGLEAKMYRFIVTDGQNCSVSDSARITEPLKLASTFIKSDVGTIGGQNGTISIKVTGGVRPYKVLRGTTEATAITQDSFVFDNLAKGNYAYIVVDNNNCTTLSQNVIIDDPTCTMAIRTILIKNVSCNGFADGRIEILTTGGKVPITFTPSVFTTNIAPNLKADTYSVTIRDSSKCRIDTTLRVTEPLVITAKDTIIRHVQTVGGRDGRTQITVSGGTQPYTVTRGGGIVATRLNATTFVFDSLPKGDYQYQIADSNRCPRTGVFTINDPECTISSQISISKPISCFGLADGAIALTVQNARNPRFEWSGGLGTVQNPTNVGVGTYTVSIKDSVGCSDSKQITLTQPAQIRATIAGDTAICNGQSARLRFTVIGATAFNLVFSNGTTTTPTTLTSAVVVPNATTTFSLVSVQSGVCRGTVSGRAIVQVTSLATPTGIQANRDSLCAGSNLSFNVTPSVLAGVQYIWQTPTGAVTTAVPSFSIPTVTPTNAGQYTVQLSQNGCLSTVSSSIRVTVVNAAFEQANAGRDTSACDGTIIKLNANPIVGRTITGRWISLDGATVIQPTINTPVVTGLKGGINRFVWMLSNSVCGDISPDTVVVFVEKKPELTEAQFNLDGSTSSIIINIKELLKDTTRFILSPLSPLQNGIAEIQNGRNIFFNRANIETTTSVEIPYRVCNVVCPNVCANSRLFINVSAINQDSTIKVPGVIDLDNRATQYLHIDGIELIENNECMIVDRWGTRVFGPVAYRNNTPKQAWDLTKNNKTLPAGAYYYIIIDKDKKILKQPKKDIIYLINGL